MINATVDVTFNILVLTVLCVYYARNCFRDAAADRQDPYAHDNVTDMKRIACNR